jgi:hypothetical protein
MSAYVRSGLLICLIAIVSAATTGCSWFDGSVFDDWWNYAHSAAYNERGVITDPAAMIGGLHR